MKLIISFVFILLCVTLLGCAAEQGKLDSPIEFPAGATLTKTELLDKIRGGWVGKAYRVSFGGPTEFEEEEEEAPRRLLYESEIKSITMLGDGKQLKWKLADEGLVIKTPRKKPCKHAYTFKIVREPYAVDK